jgi:DUF1365 family protein
MATIESALYIGTLRHRRFRPVAHEFTYPLFMSFLNIDRIPELMKVSPFASYDRWNWTSFDNRDYFGDPRLALRERLRADAEANGIDLPGGRIFLLTHLRYLGYVFNPVSFFYCYDRNDSLSTVLAAVNNTFGEMHNYWLTSRSQVATHNGRSYEFPKVFHISSFLGMNCTYRFTFSDPATSLVVQTNVSSKEGLLMDSSLKLERRPWSRASLHRVLVQYPFMTLRVIAGIHGQAARLYLKKVPVFDHPGPGLFRPVNRKVLGARWQPR